MSSSRGKRKEYTPEEWAILESALVKSALEQLIAFRGFDEVENLRQNRQWYAEQELRRREKLAIHNAICDLQNKSAVQQREWLEQQKDKHLDYAVFRHLRPEVQVELIRKETNAVLARRKEKTPLIKLRDVEAFLLRSLSQGRCIPAKKILKKASKTGISKRTLYRAKAKLGVRSERVGFGPAGQFVWSFPASEC